MVDRKYKPPILYPVVSDCYWIMLRALTKGHHKLKFQAQYYRLNGAFGNMAQDIEYELLV